MIDNSGHIRRPEIKDIIGLEAIQFCCRACKAHFDVYGEKENFCHNCGCKQDWTPIRHIQITKEDVRHYYSCSYNERFAFIGSLDARVLEYEDNTTDIS